MNATQKLGLKKPVVADDVQQTVNWLAENFQAIDDVYDEIVSDIDAVLVSGTVYELGKKYWNRSTQLDGNVGWVNTRVGTFAPVWQPLTVYALTNIVKAVTDNGHYYECISGGTSSIEQPAFSTVAGEITYDLGTHSLWTASYVYNLDDVVIASNGDKIFYYKCVTAGTSGATEPLWNDALEGSTILDGTVDWHIYKTVQWKEKGASCSFSPFGFIGTGGTSTPPTEVGVVTTGEWKATPVAVTYGGTGATTAKGARTNLGATTKYSVNVGDSSSTTIVVVHNLGTQDIIVSVRETITPSGVINPEIAIIDNNTITVTFVTAPSDFQYRVTVIG